MATARDRGRPNATDRGYDHKWRRTRGRYLKHHETCEHPGCRAPATDVHHLDGQGPLGSAGHKWDNLQALCHEHHSRLTAVETPAGIAHRGRRLRPVPRHPGLTA
jgi:5-methylcytosine-specific restriction enzyme A